jgi:gamma-glutamyl-gamma-aminobutyrate hydrolase PuuD
MNRLPRMLVVCRRHIRKAKWVDFVGEYHLDLILRFGGVPIMVPRVAGTLAVLDAYEPMDGLLIVEGEDIHPARYGGEGIRPELIQEPDLERDAIEFELIGRVLARGTPYLGMCRGSHLLNVACGGTLFADVMAEKNSTLAHINEQNYDGYRHPIRIVPGTPLAEWFGVSELLVNSYHHQGVKVLAPCFKPMAFAPDGLVEGFFDPTHPFRVGLQFHPERMQTDHPGCPRVFERFLQAARDFAASKSGQGHVPR